MQADGIKKNELWLRASEADKNAVYRLLKATMFRDFGTFETCFKEFKNAELIANAWPNVPDLPLWSVAQMVYTIYGNPEDWRNKDEIQAKKEGIEPFIVFWQDYLGVDMLPWIDYRIYHEHFFCTREDESDEEAMYWDIRDGSKRRGQRFRKIDRKLYCDATRFDFEKTKQDLDAGGNPNACLNGDKESISFRIDGELGFLSVEYGPYTEIYYKDICDLIGFAAHTEMSNLLFLRSFERSPFVPPFASLAK